MKLRCFALGADEIGERNLRTGELGLRDARVVLRALVVDLHLGDIGRREVARLQAALRRRERASEKLRSLGEHLRALLRQLQVEVRTPDRGNLLALHVERVAHGRALQPGSRIQAQLALVAALERLVDAEHRVGLTAGSDRRAADRERGIRARAGDHLLRLRGFDCATRRLKLAVVLHEQRFALG